MKKLSTSFNVFTALIFLFLPHLSTALLIKAQPPGRLTEKKRSDPRIAYFKIFSLVIIMALTGIEANSQLNLISSNTDLSGFVSKDDTKCIMTDYNSALWTTDGTASGTKKFTDKVVAYFWYSLYIEYKNEILFAGYNESTGYNLWKTDGTNEGTVLIKQINTNVNDVLHPPYMFVLFNNKVYFFAWTKETGYELWVTDGTEDGTKLIKEINPGKKGSVPSWDDGGDYYNFLTSDSSLESINNNILYFNCNDGTHGYELWRTDGTDAGTTMVKDINAGSNDSQIGHEIALNNSTVLFTADDGIHGEELWKTDGTLNGTSMVKDINAGTRGSNIEAPFKFKNKIYFKGDDNISGDELWYSDGTETGTQLLKDFLPGTDGSSPISQQAVIFGDKFIIPVAKSELNGFTNLWVSDGTTGGTTLLASTFNYYLPMLDYYDKNSNQLFINHNAPYKGKIFLWATNTETAELYTCDGKTLSYVYTYPSRSGTYFYTPQGLQFDGIAKPDTTEYYKSDGTTSGTSKFAFLKVNPSNVYSSHYNFIYKGKLYISNDDGNNSDDYKDLYTTVGSILPISLISFTAEKQQASVILNWETSNEINNDFFDIERSRDSKFFTTIGTRQALNANGTKNYSFTDNEPLYGENYYRLKQVDKDGKYSYSVTVHADFSNISSSSIFSIKPNPSSDNIKISIPESDQSSELIIYNARGEKVLSAQINAGTTLKQIYINQLSQGFYNIVLIQNGKPISKKFIKK